MGHLKHILFIGGILFAAAAHCQEWQLFTGSDEVFATGLHKNHVWVISGSGLTRIEINSGNRVNWNTINSDIPDYAYTELAVDSTGRVWLGGLQNQTLVRFDGTSWNTITEINGHQIGSILDIKVASDGKVWIYGGFSGLELSYFENDIFHELLPPDGLLYHNGTASNIGVGNDGHLWAILRDSARTVFPIGEYDGAQWILHDISSVTLAKPGPGDNFISDSKGNVYLALATLSSPNFLKYDGTSWQGIEMPANANDFLNSRRPLYMDRLDRFWIGLWNNTFLRYDDEVWDTIDLQSIGLEGGYPDGLLIDSNETEWIIYYHQHPSNRSASLYSYDGSTTAHIDLSNSDIPTNTLRNIVIDRQNRKWFGSKPGLISFDGMAWQDISALLNEFVQSPRASGHSGGVWLESYDSELLRYDEEGISSIPVLDQSNAPYSYLQNLVADNAGTVYASTGINEILVYSSGSVSYLDSMSFTLGGYPWYRDYSLHVALDSSDRLFSLGHSLHRLEDDSSWTEIPLWTESPIGVSSFKIAPSGDIWVEHGYGLPQQDGLDFMIYRDSAWSAFTSPYPIYAYPHWDTDGNLWAWTSQGLCKQDNGNWVCYNRGNSPLIPDRIMRFEIDKSNNIWITLKSGGLLLFNEDQIRDIDVKPVSVVESERHQSQLNLYPNPAQDYFTVSGDDLQPLSDYTLALYDLLGRLVFSTNGNGDLLKVNLPDSVASGVYVVSITDHAGNVIGLKRLIID